jgi:hypothetical protein
MCLKEVIDRGGTVRIVFSVILLSLLFTSCATLRDMPAGIVGISIPRLDENLPQQTKITKLSSGVRG